MDADAWDARYEASELVWSAGPNRFLVSEVEDLRPGAALDVACGEGRNTLWLAEQGWRATGVDFSPAAIAKASALARRRQVEVELAVADATDAVTDASGHQRTFDLVLVLYLHLPASQRREALGHAADAVAPGGTLLVLGHDRDNLEHGVGGPSDPAILLDATEVTADLDGRGLVVERAGQVSRDVEGEDGVRRQAIDCLVRAHRPADGGPTP